jgi:hypothetical protein
VTDKISNFREKKDGESDVDSGCRGRNKIWMTKRIACRSEGDKKRTISPMTAPKDQ